MFVELKRQKKDVIQDCQRQWVEQSLNHGFHPDDFALIEWKI